jgi:hypothetical protein
LDSYVFDLTNHPGGSFNDWFDVAYMDDCDSSYIVRLDPEFDPAAPSGIPGTTRLGL